MIAPPIIVASKGKSEPEWLETISARPCDGDVADPVGLDPPPDVVEELEDRIGGLGELLVEAPLVLVVLAGEAGGRSARRPRAAASGAPPAARSAALSGSSPSSSPERSRRRKSAVAAAVGAARERSPRSGGRAGRSPTDADRLPSAAPGCGEGNEPAARRPLGDEVARPRASAS